MVGVLNQMVLEYGWGTESDCISVCWGTESDCIRVWWDTESDSIRALWGYRIRLYQSMVGVLNQIASEYGGSTESYCIRV